MIIGVCGKIASGKTVVMEILEKLGFFCIYADKVVHELYRGGGVGSRVIMEAFGREFLFENGEVDRVRLRDLVFSDLKKLQLLNQVVHPLVEGELNKVLSVVKSENIAIESIYFDEIGMGDLVDKVLWVDRPEEDIFEVLVGERGFSAKMAKDVIDFAGKPSKIDFVVSNAGSMYDLKSSLTDLVETLSAEL